MRLRLKSSKSGCVRIRIKYGKRFSLPLFDALNCICMIVGYSYNYCPQVPVTCEKCLTFSASLLEKYPIMDMPFHPCTLSQTIEWVNFETDLSLWHSQ